MDICGHHHCHPVDIIVTRQTLPWWGLNYTSCDLCYTTEEGRRKMLKSLLNLLSFHKSMNTNYITPRDLHSHTIPLLYSRGCLLLTLRYWFVCVSLLNTFVMINPSGRMTYQVFRKARASLSPHLHPQLPLPNSPPLPPSSTWCPRNSNLAL